MEFNITFSCLESKGIIDASIITIENMGINDINNVRDLLIRRHRTHHNQNLTYKDLPIELFYSFTTDYVSAKTLTITVPEECIIEHDLFLNTSDLHVFVSEHKFNEYLYLDFDVNFESRCLFSKFWRKPKIRSVVLKYKLGTDRILKDWIIEGKRSRWFNQE